MTATITTAASIANEIREAAARARTASALDRSAYKRIANTVIDFIETVETAHAPTTAPDGNPWSVYVEDRLTLEGSEAYEEALAGCASAMDAVRA